MSEHFSCLDMIAVRWTSVAGARHCECATLLEIWARGGVLHTDQPIPAGATVSLSAAGVLIEAEVEKYDHDEFGYYLQLATSVSWFPELYQPAQLAAIPIERPLSAGS